MIRMDVEKLLESLTEIEDRRNPDEKPVLGYLHDLIVLSILRDTTPEVTEVDFDAFTVADLEEYYKVAVDVFENTFPKMEQLIKDITGIKALQATKIDFF